MMPPSRDLSPCQLLTGVFKLSFKLLVADLFGLAITPFAVVNTEEGWRMSTGKNNYSIRYSSPVVCRPADSRLFRVFGRDF